MADPKRIELKHAGYDRCPAIMVTYVRRRRTISASGSYDSDYGYIPGAEIPLGQFLRGLGITQADIDKAMKETEREPNKLQ